MRMKKLSIAIIDPVGQKGGLDHYDLSLANALIGRSCKVKIYSNFILFDNKSIVHDHFTFIIRKKWFKSFILLKEYFFALIMIRIDKADIVILHLFHSSFVDYLFVRLARLFRFRICLIIHDVESLIYPTKKSWIKKCVSLAQNIVVHNIISYNELIEKIKPIDRSKVFVIPHGNFLGLLLKTERNKIGQYFNLDLDKKYLLFFGMIKKSKGLEVLIEAMNNISSNVDLIIAGRTRDISFVHYESIIKSFNLSQRVHPIIRYITNVERNYLFNFTDLAIFPYKRIYQSGVMLLAMSYGIPVVASDLPVNKTLIDGENGVLFKVDDAADLATKVNGLIDDKMKRNSISIHAMEHVKANNDWNKIGDEFLKIFN